LTFLIIVGFILFCAISVLIGLGLMQAVDKIVENHRRKKYPVYFIGYDTAMKKSFEHDAEFNKRIDAINRDRKRAESDFEFGRCSKEEFHKNITEIYQRFEDFCEWRKASREVVNEAFSQVDLYAKEHGLKWGRV
jgi:hypothetical protein